MDSSTADTIRRILNWWHAKHGLVPGSRNANVFKLAAVFNRGNVPFAMALDECLAFADLSGPDPFTAQEITRTVRSAYRGTDHGVKQCKPRTDRQAPAGRTALSEAQAHALVDALVERLHKGAQAPAVPCSIPTPLPPTVNQVQAFIQRHNLEHFVKVMDLDLDRARIVVLPAPSAGDNTAESGRQVVNPSRGQQDANT